MRINIRQLLAVPLAFTVAWFVAGKLIVEPLAIPQSPLEAYSDVRIIADWIQMELHRDGTQYDAETLSRWLGGQLRPNDPDELKSTLSFRRDPWGNRYQVIKLRDPPPERFGVYSLGRNGISNADGTDLDDIQSWFDPSTATEMYVREAADTNAVKRFTAAVTVTAIVYLPFFFLLRSRPSDAWTSSHEVG